MSKYEVEITRSCFQTKTVLLEADSREDAMVKAYEQAGNYDYSNLEKEAEYSVEACRAETDDE